MQLYVFDIDDTLSETAKIHQEFFTQSLNELGVESFNDDYSSYVHHTDRFIFEEIFKEAFGRNVNKVDIENFELSLLEKIKGISVKAIPGAIDFIAKANERGIGLVYATGALHKTALYKLERLGFPYVEELLVASNAYPTREAIVSEAISRAKKYYGEEFSRIISFGDGLWDYRTAQNLALDFIGIGQRNKARLKEEGAKEVHDDFRTLMDFNF